MSKAIETTLYYSKSNSRGTDKVIPIVCKSKRIAVATAQNILASEKVAHPSGHWQAFTHDGQFLTLSLVAPIEPRDP